MLLCGIVTLRFTHLGQLIAPTGNRCAPPSSFHSLFSLMIENTVHKETRSCATR